MEKQMTVENFNGAMKSMKKILELYSIQYLKVRVHWMDLSVDWTQKNMKLIYSKTN